MDMMDARQEKGEDEIENNIDTYDRPNVTYLRDKHTGGVGETEVGEEGCVDGGRSKNDAVNKTSSTSVESLSDEEYDELCDAVQQRMARESADMHSLDEEQENEETDEGELQGAAQQQQQQQTDNIHTDLVTPELSAEEKECVLIPPKLSHKKSYKKRSPKDCQRKRSSRKLNYQIPTQTIPLQKATKRKLLPKSGSKQKKKKILNKKKELQERIVPQDGTWVQCMHSECLKWRYLRDVTDPCMIPEYWICEQNTDPNHNSCEQPEEDYHMLEFVFTKFTEGSIVWAKMHGYPWWPAMIEEDPDTGTYLEQEDTETLPTHYHVVFLDKNVSRTWLKSIFIRKYNPEDDVQTQAKGRDFKQQVGQAVARANTAISMNVQERIQTFGFSHTFKGKIVDNSWESSGDESADSDSGHDQVEVEEDAQLDLEMLGIDVDEILEEAEALLSETGETMLSLQDTSSFQGAPKKTKHGKKCKKIQSGNELQGKTGKEGKTKRKYTKEMPKADEKSEEEKTKKKHKSHRHHSKKENKKKEDSTVTKNDFLKYDLQDTSKDNCKTVLDITDPEPKTNKIQSKGSKVEMTGEDGLTKKVKKPRSKKGSIPKNDVAQNAQGDDNLLQVKKSDSDVTPKEKKVRKPRMKKSHSDTEPKSKKPKAKKSSAVQPNAEYSIEIGTPEREYKKFQEAEKNGTDVKPKDKKQRFKKAFTTKIKAGDVIKNSTTIGNCKASSDKAQNPPQNQDAASEPKEKRKSKTDKSISKMKPSFRPPPKSTEGTSKIPKKTSFMAPLMKKDHFSSEKVQQEARTKDEVNDYSTNQISNDGPPSKQRKLDRCDATGSKDAAVTQGKGSKFRVNKKTALSLGFAKSTPLADISKIDADSSTDLDLSQFAEPSKYSESNTSIEKVKNKRPLKEVKKGTAKKFSIKHKTPASEDPSVADKVSKTYPDATKKDTPATDMKAFGTDEHEGPTKTSVPKKFSMKHKPSNAFEKATSLWYPEIVEEDSISVSHPKKLKCDHKDEKHQIPDIDGDVEELHLDLDEDTLVDDVAKVIKRQGDKINGGYDSDDFSVEDMEEWPKNPEITDELKQGNPNKFNDLETGNGSSSQHFEMVEE